MENRLLDKWKLQLQAQSINPFVELSKICENVYAMYMVGPENMPPSWMFLVIGKDSAMLIDTGYGAGDLKKLVKSLIGDRLLVVVNTHTHPDHMLGNYQFEEVYVHELEESNLRDMMTEKAQERFYAVGSHLFCEKNQIIPFAPYRIIPFQNGMIFELGECRIEAVHVPGHSPGSCVLIDYRDRIVFSGDAVMRHICSIGRKTKYHTEWNSIENYMFGLAELKKHEGKYEVIFPAHKEAVEPDIVKDLISICETFIRNPKAADYYEERFGKDYPVVKKNKAAVLLYREE